MYKGKYSVFDLSLDNFKTLDEKTINRENILEDLWRMYNDGEYLSEHEKDFIFRNRYGKEQFKQSTLDENYFSSMYLIYANDLFGVTKLFKWFDGPLSEIQLNVLNTSNFSIMHFDQFRQNLINAKILVEIGREQSAINLDYLKKSANEWEEFLNTNRGKTSDNLLREFVRETSVHLKELKKHIILTNLGNNAFLHRKLQILLFSKYAYITAKKLIETFTNNHSHYELNLGNQKIRFNEYSIAHIFMRHYAQGVRNYSFINEKSVHIGDFPFDKMHFTLENIFTNINNSGVLDKNYFDGNIINIRFKYREVSYFVGTKVDENKNERGNIPFRRIETFHIIEDPKMLRELNEKFNLYRIDEELSLYKTP